MRRKIRAGRDGFGRGAYSYAGLKATVDRAAAGFSELGLNRGDALLLEAPSFQLTASVRSPMKLGAVAVMTNSLLKEDHLAFILGNSDAHIAAAPASLADPLRRLVAAGKLEKLVLLDDGAPHGNTEITFSDLVSRQTDIPPTADTAALDPAFMAYSSARPDSPKAFCMPTAG